MDGRRTRLFGTVTKLQHSPAEQVNAFGAPAETMKKRYRTFN
jgi:hypothetical protein